MGVSSKLIMTTNNNKEVFKILRNSESALNKLLMKQRKKIHGDNARPWTKDDNNSNRVSITVDACSESFIINFKYKGEVRQLWLFTKNTEDNSDITDKENVFFSFGSWGNHKEILMHLYKELSKEFSNEFFFDFNDCDDIFHHIKNEELVECNYN